MNETKKSYLGNSISVNLTFCMFLLENEKVRVLIRVGGLEGTLTWGLHKCVRFRGK